MDMSDKIDWVKYGYSRGTTPRRLAEVFDEQFTMAMNGALLRVKRIGDTGAVSGGVLSSEEVKQ